MPPIVIRRTLMCAAALLGPALAPAAAQQPDSLPSPLSLLRRSPGEPSWAATLRLRDAEPRYAHDRQWRSTYCQLRAQAEVWLGEHETALRTIESCSGRWSDSAYALPEGSRAVDAVSRIVPAADTARIVMVNERHHAASDRLLTLALLPELWKRGYRYFAAEAFDWNDTLLNARPYAAAGVSGGYVDEPVFGEVVREARRLGFRLVPYEMEPQQAKGNDSLNAQQRRDRAQARNLYERIFRDDPAAKVLIHAGYAHIREHADSSWFPMAAYLRDLTGIDPVTVDQTMLGEATVPDREHPGRRAAEEARLVGTAPVILVDSDGRALAPARFDSDFQVVGLRTEYVNGRPEWMTLGARRQPTEVAVPECADRLCIVEARLARDGDDAVPIDRTDVRAEHATLLLPPSEPVRIRVMSASADVLRTLEITHAATRHGRE